MTDPQTTVDTADGCDVCFVRDVTCGPVCPHADCPHKATTLTTDPVSFNWEGNDRAAMLVISNDGGASFAIKNAGARFYTTLTNFDLPHDLADAIIKCSANV